MTATVPPPTDLRDCHLYRFWVRHPLAGRRVLGYIGETVRLPFERLMEHVYSQPWADTIVAWEVDEVTYPGKAAVLEAERRAVEAERPLYNYEYNQANPLRIEIWRAKEQRWARDDQQHRPRWVPPAGRRPARAATTQTVRRDTPPREWTPAKVKASLWSISWLLLTILGSGMADRTGLTATWQASALCGSSAGALLLGWSVVRHSSRWKKAMRKIRR